MILFQLKNDWVFLSELYQTQNSHYEMRGQTLVGDLMAPFSSKIVVWYGWEGSKKSAKHTLFHILMPQRRDQIVSEIFAFDFLVWGSPRLQFTTINCIWNISTQGLKWNTSAEEANFLELSLYLIRWFSSFLTGCKRQIRRTMSISRFIRKGESYRYPAQAFCRPTLPNSHNWSILLFKYL